jgi:hypothetical protein
VLIRLYQSISFLWPFNYSSACQWTGDGKQGIGRTELLVWYSDVRSIRLPSDCNDNRVGFTFVSTHHNESAWGMKIQDLVFYCSYYSFSFFSFLFGINIQYSQLTYTASKSLICYLSPVGWVHSDDHREVSDILSIILFLPMKISMFFTCSMMSRVRVSIIVTFQK